MDEQIDRQIGAQMNRQTDGQTERWKIDRKIEILKDGKIQSDG